MLPTSFCLFAPRNILGSLLNFMSDLNDSPSQICLCLLAVSWGHASIEPEPGTYEKVKTNTAKVHRYYFIMINKGCFLLQLKSEIFYSQETKKKKHSEICGPSVNVEFRLNWTDVTAWIMIPVQPVVMSSVVCKGDKTNTFTNNCEATQRGSLPIYSVYSCNQLYP